MINIFFLVEIMASKCLAVLRTRVMQTGGKFQINLLLSEYILYK